MVNRPKRPLRTLLMVVLLALLASCSSEYTTHHQSDGDALVNKLHQAIQQQQWEALEKVYSEAYLGENSIEMIRDRWQGLIRRFGPLKGFHLRAKQHDARLQGEFYIYSYAVTFAHRTIGEIITVFRSGQDHSTTISGHRLMIGDGA